MNKIGRPRKGWDPKLPYDEVYRLLVHGENKDGQIVYPSYRDIARRYGVSNATVSNFSKKHGCMNKRRDIVAGRMISGEMQEVGTARIDIVKMIDFWLVDFVAGINSERYSSDDFIKMSEYRLELLDSSNGLWENFRNVISRR